MVGPALGHEPRLVAKARYPSSHTRMVRVHEIGGGRRGHVAVVLVLVRLSRRRGGGHGGPRGAGAHVGCRRDRLVSVAWRTCKTIVRWNYAEI